MRRRELVAGLGCAAAAWPLTGRAQQVGKIYRIGILEPIPAARNAVNFNALLKGLRDLGYFEGRNLVIEYRSADGRAERFPDLASELIGLKVDLIVARGTPATTAAKTAGTIPVVMATMGGPGAIVASFANPGGNITGMITFSTELTAKRVIGADGLTQMYQQTIVDFAARNRLPAVYPAREFVEAGGLIAYAVNYPDLYFRLASFVDKIFKGVKPGELPVEQPTKSELVIDTKGLSRSASKGHFWGQDRSARAC